MQGLSLAAPGEASLVSRHMLGSSDVVGRSASWTVKKRLDEGRRKVQTSDSTYGKLEEGRKETKSRSASSSALVSRAAHSYLPQRDSRTCMRSYLVIQLTIDISVTVSRRYDRGMLPVIRICARWVTECKQSLIT